MKKILLPVLFFGIVVLFFNSFFLKHFLPIPADTIIGLYHPFRDLYKKTNPNGIVYKNFLITDPVRQLYPWRNLSISLEKTFQLPLWNPYSFAGSPLLANFQSSVFYPLNIVLFIFPFATGWSILIFLQPILAGWFLYMYLRKLQISKVGSFFGAISFSLCGFSVSWMEWNTLVQVALWLPLILLAKEHLLEKQSKRWICILVLAEITQFFAGHLQTLFYSMLVSNSYLFGRIIQISHEKYNGTSFIQPAIKKYIPFLFIGVFVYTVTIIQWIPTLQFIGLSARDVDQSNWQQPGWFIPWQNLAQFIAPDFFGNPATLNYWGVWNYAEFIGYIGIVPLVLACVALMNRRDKKTLFFGLLCFGSLLFALPTGISTVPFLLKLPLISTSQPTRLLFITDFSLSVLAALGWDQLKKKNIHAFIPIGIIGLFFCLLWILVFWANRIGLHIEPVYLSIAKRNLFFPTGIYFVTLLLVCMYYGSKKQLVTKTLVGMLILLVAFDLLRFANKFTPFTPQKYLFPSTTAISFLQKNIGNYRFMTTDSQILPPNFSVMYHLQSIDGYDPLFLRSYAELIAASQRGRPNINPPFGFNRIITPHTFQSRIINLLGVKYIVSLTDIADPQLKKVFQEGDTRIYENDYVLARAFFVKQVVSASDKQDAMNQLFNPLFDPKQTAVVINGVIKSINKSIYSIGTVRINQYTENKIVLVTENNRDGFLVTTDIFYPNWHVIIDGKDGVIIPVDYAFRGVYVPKGRHTITFFDTLW